MSNKRKGFTLVELLIVIVVIGILSAMMMLSSTEATSSARASNVISNMRNLKTAALAFYVDNLSTYRDGTTLAAEKMSEIIKYMNNSSQMTSESNTYDGYGVESGEGEDNSDQWFVTYNFKDMGTSEATRVKAKLKGRAKSVGLLAGKTDTSTTTGEGDTATTTGPEYVGGETVYMRVK